MVCSRCKIVVKSVFENMGINPIAVELGEVELKNDIDSQMVCMNEVVGSLQRQIQSIELEKETNKKKYTHEIELQQKVSILY